MKIFVAGPVNAPKEIQELTPKFEDIGHREPEFENVFRLKGIMNTLLEWMMELKRQPENLKGKLREIAKKVQEKFYNG